MIQNTLPPVAVADGVVIRVRKTLQSISGVASAPSDRGACGCFQVFDTGRTEEVRRKI